MTKPQASVLFLVLCQSFCKGFDLTFDPHVPDPTAGVTGRQVCGVVRCSETLVDTSRDQTNRSRTLSKLTIFKSLPDGSTSNIEPWQELAIVSTSQSTLNWVSDGVMTTGQLTAQQASLSLELTKTRDCEESQFSCEAIITDDLGRTSVKRSIVGKALDQTSFTSMLNRADKASMPQSRNFLVADSRASLSGTLVQLVSSLQIKIDMIGFRVEDSLRTLENRLEDKVSELKTVANDKTESLDKSMETRFDTLDTRIINLENRLEDKIEQLQNSLMNNLRQVKGTVSDKADTCDEISTKLDKLRDRLHINSVNLDTCVINIKKQNESTWKALVQIETAVEQCTTNQDTDLALVESEINKLSGLTQLLVSKVDSFTDNYGNGALVPVDEFFDPLNTGKKEWRLAFRGTAYNNVRVYPAYLYGTGIPVEVEQGCKQFNDSLPCINHYRNHDALKNWVRVDEVLFAIYKDGQMVKRVVFSGKGSTFTSWFAADRVILSSWTDLTTQPHNYFSIAGADHNDHFRRFFINLDYQGSCDGFRGWFKATENQKGCPMEASFPAVPTFQFAPSSTFAVWKTNAAEADAFGIFLKYE